ncbi:MAG TPA: MGMT family protein [Bryobacteraceae bacterium]|nr:MGMT family protein [Bryobacteraceae bacterium]
MDSVLEQLRRVVSRIPKGRVASYGDVARAAGYPGAARQVAWALHNAKGGIPWHRVLGAGGHIRLPGQAGLEQRMRLAAEGVTFRGSRVDMARHAFDFNQKRKRP